MTTAFFTRTLTLSFVASGAALLPFAVTPHAQRPQQAEIAALQASVDPSLGALRAGRVAAPAPFGTRERAELSAAQEQSSSLPALRAGFQPTDHEWTWLGIGAGIVLLIVLL